MSLAHSATDNTETLHISPLAGALGAEIFGVDLTEPVTDTLFAEIYSAFLKYQAIFFPHQKELSSDHLTSLASRFGELDSEPFVGPFKYPNVDDNPHIFSLTKEAADSTINLGGFWHADVTYRARPHKAGLLYSKESPKIGGDTMFANQYLAYDTLSEGMKEMLGRLNAVHSNGMDYGNESARFGAVGQSRAPTHEDRKFSNLTYDRPDNLELVETEHPIVRVHPETGRKSLYVNRGFTVRLSGMTKEESLPILESLWSHACRPEFTCRYRWTKNTVGIWDNRCTLHYALNDYYGERRVMYRVAVNEER